MRDRKEYDRRYYITNHERILERQKQWYYFNRERVCARRRRRKVWSLYRDKKMGIVRPKSAICRLCGKVVRGNNLCCDHNHKTGKFRGWLCRACNRSLGWYERRKKKIARYIG